MPDRMSRVRRRMITLVTIYNSSPRFTRRCLLAWASIRECELSWARSLRKDRGVAAEAIEVRPAEDSDRRPLALLFAAVAEERDGIAAEPPIDVEKRAANWRLDGTLVALGEGEVVGLLNIKSHSGGCGEIGMMVAADWRGRGVGTALVVAAIEWARANQLHKLTLSVFPHNEAAIALYRKFGFLEEGRRPKQIRRANGELWDLIEMGLLL
jgi:RimJ/RimL family protein N-acetyltransferase